MVVAGASTPAINRRLGCSSPTTSRHTSQAQPLKLVAPTSLPLVHFVFLLHASPCSTTCRRSLAAYSPPYGGHTLGWARVGVYPHR